MAQETETRKPKIQPQGRAGQKPGEDGISTGVGVGLYSGECCSEAKSNVDLRGVPWSPEHEGCGWPCQEVSWPSEESKASTKVQGGRAPEKSSPGEMAHNCYSISPPDWSQRDRTLARGAGRGQRPQGGVCEDGRGLK